MKSIEWNVIQDFFMTKNIVFVLLNVEKDMLILMVCATLNVLRGMVQILIENASLVRTQDVQNENGLIMDTNALNVMQDLSLLLKVQVI